jgi:hypothetical protein
VCCNALLAAYARACPPQWRRALRLLELMAGCGGELAPDIVSFNTVMKGCGNAGRLDAAFQVGPGLGCQGCAGWLACAVWAAHAALRCAVKCAWAAQHVHGQPIWMLSSVPALPLCLSASLPALPQRWRAGAAGGGPSNACLAPPSRWTPPQVYRAMRARGLEPSATTFGTLIGLAADAADTARVREAWVELQRSGLPVHVSAANAYLAALLREVGGWGWRAGWLASGAGWRWPAGGRGGVRALAGTTAAPSSLLVRVVCLAMPRWLPADSQLSRAWCWAPR